MRLVDLTFFTNHEYADTTALLKAQQASLFYIAAIKENAEIEVIKHVSPNTTIISKKNFAFFVSKNIPGYIPAATILYLKKIKPDVVIVHGLGFPLHVIRLKLLLGRNVKIIAWHHAEHPARWPKKIWYGLADRCIAKYLFTSKENAAEWVGTGTIKNDQKIAEVPPTLTVFQRVNPNDAKLQLQMGEGLHYLWVGRLDPVKDPLTAVRAFERWVETNPSAKLHMIYQSGTLASVVEEYVLQSPTLKKNILLHGAIPNAALATWYSAADFFISASTREAGSVTILEAMACGCIPLVTAIPASLKVTNNGKYGFSYEVGDVDGLLQLLIQTKLINRERLAAEIQSWFAKEFSVDAVACKLLAVCESIIRK